GDEGVNGHRPGDAGSAGPGLDRAAHTRQPGVPVANDPLNLEAVAVYSTLERPLTSPHAQEHPRLDRAFETSQHLLGGPYRLDGELTVREQNQHRPVAYQSRRDRRATAAVDDELLRTDLEPSAVRRSA